MEVEENVHFLDTTLGELAFFRSIAHARPAGAHRDFHLISVRQSIKESTGHDVDIADLRIKLGVYYNLDAVAQNELVEGELDDPDVSTPSLPRTPEPLTPHMQPLPGTKTYSASGTLTDREFHRYLSTQPHFRTDFKLPQEYSAILHERRLIPGGGPDPLWRDFHDPPTDSEEDQPLAQRHRSHSHMAPASGGTASALARTTPASTASVTRNKEAADGDDSSELSDLDEDEGGGEDVGEAGSSYSAARQSVATFMDEGSEDELNIPSSRRKRDQMSVDSVASKSTPATTRRTASKSKAPAPSTASSSKKKRKR